MKTFPLAVVSAGINTASAQDPLPSWNDGPGRAGHFECGMLSTGTCRKYHALGDMILFFVTEVVIESKTDSYIMTVCLG